MATLDIFDLFKTSGPARSPEWLHLRDFYGALITGTTPTELSLAGPSSSWTAVISGVGLTYDTNSQLSGGTVTGLAWSFQANATYSDFVFKFSQGVSAQIVTQWMIGDSTQTALATIFNGADTITDSTLATLVHGYAGNDTIYGYGGGDSIYGDSGDDVIFGNGAPGGTTSAFDQSNYLRGDDGADRIYGGFTFDDINGNKGNDTCYGGDGHDWVVGGQDNDLLYGENGNDIVYGNLGADTVFGGDGNDWVRGGQDDDQVFGGDGNDWLWGDRGSDTLTGGAGADLFHSFSGAGVDRITDFQYAEGDRIILDDRVPYTITQLGGDAVITLGGAANGDRIVLAGVSAAGLPGDTVTYA